MAVISFYPSIISRPLLVHPISNHLQPEGEDDLKKIQLMELAIMNGTYRDQTKLIQAAQTARKSETPGSGKQRARFLS